MPTGRWSGGPTTLTVSMVTVRLLSRALLASIVVACAGAALATASASAATRFVSAGGADAGSCDSRVAPCRSFSYAYRQSAAGDVVEVAGGSYPAQTVPPVAGRSGAPVDFRATGAVSLADLDISGDHVVVQGISTPVIDVDDGDGVRDVTVIGARASRLWIQNAHGLHVIGGSYGDNKDTPTVQIAGEPASSNLTFDSVDFHDAVATNSSVHMECIWAGGVQGMTVRNSIFRNCAYFDIFFTRLNGPDPRDVLLENNVFEAPKQWNGQDAPYAVNVANWLSKAENFVFRNNSFGADVTVQPPASNFRFVGNVGPIASCKSGVAYSYNVFSKTKCSATDKQVGAAMSQFVNPGAHDWRLRAGAAAINAGSPSDFPPTDREGLLRAGPPDAGAHEFGGLRPDSGGPPPTRGLQGQKRPRKGGKLKVRTTRAKVCKRRSGGRRARRVCRRVLRVRVDAGRRARVELRLQRRRGSGWTTVRRLRRTVGDGTGVLALKVGGLRRGRYRLVVRARRLPAGTVSTRRLRVVLR